MATKPLPSWVPQHREGSKLLHRPCVLEVANVEKNKNGPQTLSFLASPMWKIIQMARWNLPAQHPKSWVGLEKAEEPLRSLGFRGGEKVNRQQNMHPLGVTMVGGNHDNYVSPA